MLLFYFSAHLCMKCSMGAIVITFCPASVRRQQLPCQHSTGRFASDLYESISEHLSLSDLGQVRMCVILGQKLGH